MLKLVKYSAEFTTQLIDMMDEWTATNEKIVPWAICRCDYHNTDQYMENIFVGAVNIRHYLNDKLRFSGGHIGDGIRPSERGKGLGTEMIALALEECRKLGISEVLMCCKKTNLASARTIEKNGGVLENEVLDDGVSVLRYWIKL